ncbi:hypothetical protein ANOM_007397 [Aspergillus nomiae NRRL 13137]|uniref:SET domain-containing protein n=1 Tax=Aspergillus nomiae NRRL (strain ATCC 15546 / NRRL 13137 / CBS 260.88 / M93) TaxID=1509407 RepID=A0A0L1IXV6_ASPN3|nr:uncharacterized protein ANOM_007397 [Aspergillus nomiae NRRL 13137]KNG84245.1 hypothetical protein ANOM_007397 [Aspergillus nomiae NRRL 13137]
MNTHNVSSAPGCIQLLQQHKKQLQDAQSHQGQCLSIQRPRDETILGFNLRRAKNQDRSSLNHSVRSSIIPPAYHPCTRSVCDLQPIMIKDLRVETHHRDSYLLLRSVTPPDEMTAILAIVEDENGDVLMLQLYNQDMDRPVEENLPEGTALIVKEPFLKLMSDGEYGIRIDHVSDIIFLSAFDERVPLCWRPQERPNFDVDHWKMTGDEFCDNAKYQLAIESYTKALNGLSNSEESNTLRLSRAYALLKARRFDEALLDLNSIPQTSPSAEKALVYKVLALYNLHRYRQCHQVLSCLGPESSGNPAIKDYPARVLRHLEEQEHGKYQFKPMYQASKDFSPDLDHATYIGPVAVKPSGSRGRGLFTTEAVKAGDLLLCEKAFAHISADPEQDNNVTLLMNIETDTMTVGTQSDLIRVITQRLYQSPALIKQFTDLHHGSYNPVNISDVDGKPVLDSFLIARIVSLNAFGCPPSSREYYLADKARRLETGDQFHSCGVWPKSSYINHSCDSNTQRSFIGDMIIIRAAKDLDPDTEITFWYATPDVDDFDTHRDKFQHWGFECDCIICQDYQNTDASILEKRQTLRTEVRQYIQSTRHPDLVRIESTVASLASTYSRPAREVPRLGIWDVQCVLAKKYLRLDQPVKAIEAVFGALESLGYIIQGADVPDAPLVVVQWGFMVDQLIEIWLVLAEAFHTVSPELEAMAERYARITYKICVGEDETFEDTYITNST